jgi:hypothetical protein
MEYLKAWVIPVGWGIMMWGAFVINQGFGLIFVGATMVFIAWPRE